MASAFAPRNLPPLDTRGAARLAAAATAAQPPQRESNSSTSSQQQQHQLKKKKEEDTWYGALEAQWVLAVFDNAFANVTLVSYLTEDILTDPVIDSLDHEVVIALREYFQVEKHYSDLLSGNVTVGGRNNASGNVEDAAAETTARKTSTEADANSPDSAAAGGGGTPKSEVDQRMINELRIMLADTLRTITRLLKQNPVLVRRLRELGGKRSGPMLQFINYMVRLRMLVNASLRQTAEAEAAEAEQLARLRQRETVDKTRFVELTKRLTMERREHSEAIEDKDRCIARVRAQIEGLHARAQHTRASFESKCGEEDELATSIYKDTERELLEDLDRLERDFLRRSEESVSAEMSLHRKKYHRAADIEVLIKQYDEELTATHRAHAEMKAIYEKESEELAKLQDYFGQVDAEAERVRDEVQAINEARDAEVFEDRKREQAAEMVSNLFNRYQQKRGIGPPIKKKKRRKSKKSKK